MKETDLIQEYKLLEKLYVLKQVPEYDYKEPVITWAEINEQPVFKVRDEEGFFRYTEKEFKERIAMLKSMVDQSEHMTLRQRIQAEWDRLQRIRQEALKKAGAKIFEDLRWTEDQEEIHLFELATEGQRTMRNLLHRHDSIENELSNFKLKSSI